MGTVINVHNGEWMRRDSGVGAGSDSYYEYCLKSYILLGDDEYLQRFKLVRALAKQTLTSFPVHLLMSLLSLSAQNILTLFS